MSLTNPLEQLAVLPNLMNYKGAWNNAVQYYKNDLVVDSNNGATYILTGAVTDLGGNDPISNSAWFELMPHVTSVDGFSAGNGIGLTPPATNPTITNTGVRTFAAANGCGAAVIGQVAELFNTGLLGMVSGTGISHELSNGTLTILNNGVVGAIRVGLGNTGTPQQLQLTNLGVNSIGAGDPFIAVSLPDPSGNVSIANQGLLSLSSGNGVIINGAYTRQVSAFPSAPVLDVLSVLGTMVPNPVVWADVVPRPFGLIPVDLDPNSFLAYQLTNGSADPNPTWVFDLTGLWIEMVSGSAGIFGPFADVPVALVDDVTSGGPHTYFGSTGAGGGLNGNLCFEPNNIFQANLGRVIAKLSDLRSDGLQTISKLRVINTLAPSGASPSSPLFIRVISYGPIQLHYYPNGLP